MVSITNLWPVAQWRIDILGPLPKALFQRKFLIISINYFMKWIEAKPLAKITKRNAKNVVWKNIVYRFGIPMVIISDNAKQFDNDGFKLFCSNLAISNHFFSPNHPQVKVINRTILRNLKAWLEKSKNK